MDNRLQLIIIKTISLKNRIVFTKALLLYKIKNSLKPKGYINFIKIITKGTIKKKRSIS